MDAHQGSASAQPQTEAKGPENHLAETLIQPAPPLTLPPPPEGKGQGEADAVGGESLPPSATPETFAPDTRADGLPPVVAVSVVGVPGYEVLGELGRGGMGGVYKARQLSLNRFVALKMIRSAEYAAQQEVSRFKAEAEAVAKLQHPNIVQVHEIGEHNGLPFFSLEFCPGGSLDKQLTGTGFRPDEAARLVECL